MRLDLDDLADLFARHLPGQRVDEFLPEDGEVYAASSNLLGYRPDDDLDRWVVKPLADLLKERVAGLGKPHDGVWRLRWAGLPGDLQVELAAYAAG